MEKINDEQCRRFVERFMCFECHGVRTDEFCYYCKHELCFDSYGVGCPNKKREYIQGHHICNYCWRKSHIDKTVPITIVRLLE